MKYYWIVMFIALVIASTTDIKKRRIPIWIFPSAAFISLSIKVITNEFSVYEGDILRMIIGGTSFFVMFVLLALFAKGGGGDAIMMACIGATMYFFDTMLISLYAALSYVAFAVTLKFVKGKNLSLRKLKAPFVPFVTVGFVILGIQKILQR